MTISPDLEAQILRYYHVEKWRVGTIARQLHVHHGTVARVLAQAGLPRIGPPARWMRLARSELATAACSILNHSRRSASELLASAMLSETRISTIPSSHARPSDRGKFLVETVIFAW